MLLQHRDQVSITIMSHSKENLERRKLFCILEIGKMESKEEMGKIHSSKIKNSMIPKQ
jgi:hypothetical protein